METITAKKPPLDGLAASLEITHFACANTGNGLTKLQGGFADPAKDPAVAFDNKFKIQATLDAVGAARAKTSDANSFLYLVKANQLANADPAKINIPTLIIYTPTDLFFYAPYVEEAAKKIAEAQTATLTGPNGHLNGVLAVSQQGDKIKTFLAK